MPLVQQTRRLGISLLLLLLGVADVGAQSKPDPAGVAGPPGLVEAMAKRYGPYRDQASYRQQLRERTFYWNGEYQRGIDVGARDALVRDLADAVDAVKEPRNTRVLMVESIDGDWRRSLRYRRIVMVCDRGPLVPAQRPQASSVKEVTGEQWKPLAKAVEGLLAVGGTNNGYGGDFHNVDTLVVTYFDGTRWRSDTWFWLVVSPETVGWTKASETYRQLLRQVVAVEPRAGEWSERLKLLEMIAEATKEIE